MSIDSSDKFNDIKHLFIESLAALNKLWSEDYNNSYMPSNLIRAVEVIIDKNISVKGTIFDILVNSVHQILPRSYLHEKELVRSALADYLLLAATKSHISREIFKEEDISDVSDLLIEDIGLEWYECRVFALISGISMINQVVQIDGDTRIRRATRFEVKVILEESKFDNQEIVEIDLLNAMRYVNAHIYVLESKVSPEEPSNPRNISSRLIDPSFDSLENLIMMFRVFCGIGVGTHLLKIGCWVDTSRNFGTRHPSHEVAPCELMRSITMSGKSLSIYPTTYELDSQLLEKIREMWNHYNTMTDTAPYFLSHFMRAVIRYGQSLNERYLEDKFIDLVLCLETILLIRGRNAAVRGSVLLGTETTEEKIKEDLNWLYDERNQVAHGGRLSIDDTLGNHNRGWDEVDDEFKNKLRRVEIIIRDIIMASIFVAKEIDEETEGERTASLLLKSIDDESSKKEICQRIPQWIFDDITNLYI